MCHKLFLNVFSQWLLRVLSAITNSLAVLRFFLAAQGHHLGRYVVFPRVVVNPVSCFVTASRKGLRCKIHANLERGFSLWLFSSVAGRWTSSITALAALLQPCEGSYLTQTLCASLKRTALSIQRGGCNAASSALTSYEAA